MQRQPRGRIDTTSLPENKGLRGGLKAKSPDPDPGEIAAMCAQFLAQMTPKGRRLRHAFAEWRVRSLEPTTIVVN